MSWRAYGMDVEAIIEAHRAAGRRFTAAGVGSFVREQGVGEPVLCMHGVPASSFLYRKLLAELAGRGLRGVAFDLPGLGLADRPGDFDYSWTGLSRIAVDALGLDRFHLVVHDLGGPVGFELAATMPARVRSLTILNTMIEVDHFRRPWVMQPFAWGCSPGEATTRAVLVPPNANAFTIAVWTGAWRAWVRSPGPGRGPGCPG